MSYEEYRHNKIQSGQLYQDFICDLLLSTLGIAVQVYSSRIYQMEVGESRQGLEIKHDEKFCKTGNLWIEVGEKARPRGGDYAEAGIKRHDNAWAYVIGDYDTVFLFPLNILRLIHSSGRYPERENNTKTSVGFLLPRRDAEKYASIILEPKATMRVKKHVKDLEQLGRELHALLLADGKQGKLFSEAT